MSFETIYSSLYPKILFDKNKADFAYIDGENYRLSIPKLNNSRMYKDR